MATRNYQSIGEVLVSVKTEFPDITISKIRFLESEGLIDPERTPSGYRKFYEKDVDRLRSILRMQRDEYLPLKVIKDRLLEHESLDGQSVDAPVEPDAVMQFDAVDVQAGRVSVERERRRAGATAPATSERPMPPRCLAGSTVMFLISDTSGRDVPVICRWPTIVSPSTATSTSRLRWRR